MIFLQIVAQGHHGYPQPENDYYKSVYVIFCERCGIHGSQRAPFQVKRVQLAPHSDLSQLNWIFDVFFVRPDVAVELANNGIDGITFGLVLDHRTGAELQDRRQMRINTVISCVDTSRLSIVTCRPDNEESQWKIAAGRTRYNASTPYCGGVKHHP
jgi:hypothetical protein